MSLGNPPKFYAGWFGERDVVPRTQGRGPDAQAWRPSAQSVARGVRATRHRERVRGRTAEATPRIMLSLLLLAAACGGDAPPPPPSLDGSSSDAGLPRDAAPRSDANPRRDAAVLPPADVEVILPYLGPEVVVTRSAEADPGKLDVHFSIDTTGSFGGEINTLQRDLSDRILPDIGDRVGNVAFGVSRFEDFPSDPYGFPDDRPFELLTPMTTRRTQVRSGVARLDQPLGAGGDLPESGYEALYQIATGVGFQGAGVQYIPAFAGGGAGSLGGVGFREGALHVVVHATDAPSHTPESYEGPFATTHGIDDVIAAMLAIDGKLIGIASSEAARPQLEELALRTGAVTEPSSGECATGVDGSGRPPIDGACPLVFDIGGDGSGLSSAIVDAIVRLLDTVRYEEVYGLVHDDRLGFLQAIEALETEPGDSATPPTRADLRPMDGIDDTFLDVRVGTALRFALRLRNDTLPPADYDQHFRLTVQIVGDGLILDEVTIRVVVPFGRLDAGVPSIDGGAGDAAVDVGAADAVPGDGA